MLVDPWCLVALVSLFGGSLVLCGAGKPLALVGLAPWGMVVDPWCLVALVGPFGGSLVKHWKTSSLN